MKRFALLSVLVAFGLGACERHEFDGQEGTKRLHGHGDSHGDAHGDPHPDHPGDEVAH